MDRVVPTTTVSAKDLRIGDVLVEMPRQGIEPWRGRRRVKSMAFGAQMQIVLEVEFPAEAQCRAGCSADPRSCIHYGAGGGMFMYPAPDEQEVIVIRD